MSLENGPNGPNVQNLVEKGLKSVHDLVLGQINGD